MDRLLVSPYQSECLLAGKLGTPRHDDLPGGRAVLTVDAGALFRRSSAVPSSELSTEACDEPEFENRTPNRIALAKSILAEACAGFACKFPRSASMTPPSKAEQGMNSAGPLSSLLALLQSAASPDKARCCLDTLTFLLLDRANRKVVSDLKGVDVILEVMRKFSDCNVQVSALEAAAGLVKHDDKDKANLWKRDDQHSIVGLISMRCPAYQLLQVLRLIKKIAFQTDGNAPVHLLEPKLVSAMASLLHPHADGAVLQVTLKFLHTAALCTHAGQLSVWHSAIFKIVPLLSEDQPRNQADADHDSEPYSWSMLDAAMQPLLSLSDHEAFHNALYAAGSISPLLLLLRHRSDTVHVTSSCILANLAETALCRQQLSQELTVCLVLDVLNLTSCTESTVGLLYILGRLASSSPEVVDILRRFGAEPLMLKMESCIEDEDVVLGLQQLLELIACSSAAVPLSSNAKAMSPEKRDMNAETQIRVAATG